MCVFGRVTISMSRAYHQMGCLVVSFGKLESLLRP